MDNTVMKETLKKLVDAYGPSGYEDQVRQVIEAEIENYVDELYVDTMGNLVAVRKGDKASSLMLAAHMDEIGVIVTHIDEKGFLRVSAVGGIPLHQLPGQRFVLANGTVGTVYHEKLKNMKELEWSKIYLDIGAVNRDEAVKKVNIGDMAVPFYPMSDQGGRCVGKAMDDRAGCAVLVETIKRLPEKCDRALYFVFSVQEELGARGAKPVAYTLEPAMAVAVDVTLTGDTPEAPRMDVSLGQGPAVKIKDSSVITHPRVREMLVQAAEKIKIPYQMEVLVRGGTDAGAISLSRGGIPSGAVSIPCRYVHTSSEMVDTDDMENAVKLLLEVCS